MLTCEGRGENKEVGGRGEGPVRRHAANKEDGNGLRVKLDAHLLAREGQTNKRGGKSAS